MGFEHWVSVSEAARVLGLPLSTLQRWVADGRLTTRVGERGSVLLVDAVQVDELVGLRGSGGRLARVSRGAGVARARSEAHTVVGSGALSPGLRAAPPPG